MYLCLHVYHNAIYQDRAGYVHKRGSHAVHRLYRLKSDGMGYDLIVAEFANAWFWGVV